MKESNMTKALCFSGRMYQFVVSATCPKVTRMPIPTGSNRWASRAVVILQLAAWSAVGVVLLQKGVSSLQKSRETQNVTQMSRGISTGFNRYSEEELSMIPLYGNVSKNLISKGDDRLWSDGQTQEILSGPKKKLTEKKMRDDGEKLYVLKKTVERQKNKMDDDINAEIFSSINSPEDLSSMKLINLKMNKTDVFMETFTDNPMIFLNDPQISEEPSHDSELAFHSTTGLGVWESRRRLRLSHLSGGGAAAAVAMVAVGALMLVLGPVVILLRLLDERRRERRFSKLSNRDDLPPTYEQATFMNEAPRYSSLSLNTILGPPPPPSSTPTRVHIV